MKRIAVIEDGYVRDSQIFTADPQIMDEDENWEDNFDDLKNPCQYVGVFDGEDEAQIKQKAADSEGVHPDVITLIDFEKSGCVAEKESNSENNTEEYFRAEFYFTLSKGYKIEGLSIKALSGAIASELNYEFPDIDYVSSCTVELEKGDENENNKKINGKEVEIELTSTELSLNGEDLKLKSYSEDILPRLREMADGGDIPLTEEQLESIPEDALKKFALETAVDLKNVLSKNDSYWEAFWCSVEYVLTERVNWELEIPKLLQQSADN